LSISSNVKLPNGELAKLADLQHIEEVKRKLGDPSVPLFKEVRELILRKCTLKKEQQIRAVFEKQPFGELEWDRWFEVHAQRTWPKTAEGKTDGWHGHYLDWMRAADPNTKIIYAMQPQEYGPEFPAGEAFPDAGILQIGAIPPQF